MYLVSNLMLIYTSFVNSGGSLKTYLTAQGTRNRWLANIVTLIGFGSPLVGRGGGGSKGDARVRNAERVSSAYFSIKKLNLFRALGERNDMSPFNRGLNA